MQDAGVSAERAATQNITYLWRRNRTCSFKFLIICIFLCCFVLLLESWYLLEDNEMAPLIENIKLKRLLKNRNALQ